MHYQKKQQGFTLIELMIVVVIIAILAAIAIPSYQSQVRSSNRADAQGALMNFAQAMERHYTESGTYEGAANGGSDTGAPGIFPTQVPINGGTARYNLEIVSADEDGYELRADAVGSQQEDGDLTIDSAGRREWDKNNSGTMKTW
ncbi:type IV pilin protein [Microbulbifer litoralis]|uniref:type IV pilin protein n=1 Tax=Microbulbifer litoralis TaxID=2933965 RepID=UPI0031F2E8AD